MNDEVASPAPDPSLSASEDGDAGPVADADLHALLLQARRNGDVPLHRLVIAYMTLRRVTADVVGLVAAREGGASIAGTPLLKRARKLTTAPPR